MRPWHKKFPDQRKSYVITDNPNGPAGGCFIEWCRVFGTTPLTCTIFDPVHFGNILRNHVFHISPTRLKNSIMGNHLGFGLKIAHRGDTDSHRGKRMLACVLKEWICALLLVFVCFGLLA